MEYHRTRDILHVMQILGHKSIRNTLMDTQLVDFKEDDYIARIAHSEEETCQLIEAGFEFVCDFGINKVFKKTQVTPAQNGRGLSMAGGEGFDPPTRWRCHPYNPLFLLQKSETNMRSFDANTLTRFRQYDF
jgi:hypothetical protein